ncbi:hypothetical protein GcM1_096004, partial [Golovinomyces cichoracearum]
EIEDELGADKLPFDSRFNPNWDNKNLPLLSKLSATLLTTKQNTPDKTESISKCNPNSQQKLRTIGQYSAKTSDSYWIKGLPIMLKGNARIHYYQSLFPHIDETTSFKTVQDMTLDSSILKSPEKSISENFEIMLTKLRDLQLGLAPRFRDEDFLYTKLLQACKRNSVCELACFKPAPTFEGLIIDLRASTALKSESKDVENKEPQIYYTDRRYKSRPTRNYQTPYDKNNSEKSRKCFICKKSNCWSSKHTDEEREKHRNKWQKKFQVKVNHRYNQYLVEGLDEIPEQEDSSDAKIEA